MLIGIMVVGATMTSCTTSASVLENSDKVAGYTLKNKKELMKQKIANEKRKTVIATP